MKTFLPALRPAQIAAFSGSPHSKPRKIRAQKNLLTLLVVLLSSTFGYAQYTINGSAYANSQCGCYTITQNLIGEAGSVWNINTIDLTNSFDYTFDVYLGCGGLGGGADGVVFALQPIGTGIGVAGGGMGLQGVAPSFGVFIDTYQNLPDNDPWDDHLSINSNGNVSHNGAADDLAGPAVIPDIENCAWNAFRVSWNASTLTFQVFLNGTLYLTYTGDIVTNIFGGDPNVFFGFTGATGLSANLQQICSSVQATFLPSVTTACLGDPVTFSDGSSAGGPILNWSWDLGDGNFSTSQNFSHTYTTAGTYDVDLTVTDVAGCTDTYTIPVTIAPLPAVTITGTDPLCAGETNGALTAVGVGGTPAYSYDWATGGTNPNVTNATAGIYDIVITDANGCTSTASHTLVEPAAIIAVTTATTSDCGQLNGLVDVSATGGTVSVDYSYEWLDSLGTAVGGAASVNNLPSGTYTVIVTDDNGCTVTVIATITGLTAGTASAAVTSSYNGEQISCAGSCDGEALVAMVGGAAPFSYAINGASQTAAQVTSLCAGNYTIIVTDDVGCTSTVSVTLADPTPITLSNVVSNETCAGDCDGSIALTASGGTAPHSYTFNNGATYVTPDNLGALCAAGYDVGAMDVNGCMLDLDLTVAEGIQPLDPTIGPVDDFCTGDGPTALAAATANGVWSGDGITDEITGTFDPAVAGVGSHTVYYDVNGSCGISVGEIVILVSTPDLFVPNVFTPNSDGFNDELVLLVGEITDYNLQVFSRWGALIFESNSSAISWDGRTSSGNEAAEGTYFFILAGESACAVLPEKGVVTLLR
jgi:gliding motility-associated-like protein